MLNIVILWFGVLIICLYSALYLDEPFISIALEKCKEFIKFGILPEILGKWYSREAYVINKKLQILTLLKLKSDS